MKHLAVGVVDVGVDSVEVWASDESCARRFVGITGALARRERRAARLSCISETDSLVVTLRVFVRWTIRRDLRKGEQNE